VGGAVHRDSLILQCSEVDGLAFFVDESFWETRLPIKVRGGGEGGADEKADGGEERFHGAEV
jgi:hypothetical protein